MSLRGADGTIQDRITIEHDPVMESVAYVLSRLDGVGRLALRSKGNSIPNAVAVANIIRDMNTGVRVQKIILDTESAPGIGRMTSTVEIILDRS